MTKLASAEGTAYSKEPQGPPTGNREVRAGKTTLVKHLMPEQMGEREREGLCFQCKEKWSPVSVRNCICAWLTKENRVKPHK